MSRWIFALAVAAIFGLSLVFLSATQTSRAEAQSKNGASYVPLLASTDWLNRRATSADLAGKVVVVDVFTVDCYNCQNVVATLRALNAQDRERGLAIVGIHSPETPAEKGRAYVSQSLATQGIVWPVAVDNAFSLWNAYGVTAWPTQLFFDRHGRLRKTVVGDSQDGDVRDTVAALLAEK